MAGKHVGAFTPNLGISTEVVGGFEWNPKTSRAYDEGRRGAPDPGHATGSDAAIAFKNGKDNLLIGNLQFETALGLAAGGFEFEGVASPDNISTDVHTFILNPPQNAVDVWCFVISSQRTYAPRIDMTATLDGSAMVNLAQAGDAANSGTPDCQLLHLAAGGVGVSLTIDNQGTARCYFCYAVYFTTGPTPLDASGSDFYTLSSSNPNTVSATYVPTGTIAFSAGSFGEQAKFANAQVLAGVHTILDQRAGPLTGTPRTAAQVFLTVAPGAGTSPVTIEGNWRTNIDVADGVLLVASL